MKTKSETIDAIRALAPTANPAFLSEFSGDELHCYLRRLTGVAGKHLYAAPDEFADDVDSAGLMQPQTAPSQPADPPTLVRAVK